MSRRACLARPLSVVSLVTFAASAAMAQTPGQQTSNPFTSPIPTGVTVRVGDFAVVPDSNSAKPRMNAMTALPDGRAFVVDQRGPVYNLSLGGSVSPYINLATAGLNLLNDNGERGVGSVAFHPQFTLAGTPGFGKFYTALSTNNLAPAPDYAAAGASNRTHDEVIYEFTAANPSAATYAPAASPREVLRIARPNSNHNGGGLAFNPNAAVGSADYGQLYYSTGDSGGSGDPFNEAQKPDSLMGKILRINPLGNNGPGGKYGITTANVFATDTPTANTRAEIFATGFRNPQRFSFDLGGTGRLFAGDIGQGVVEEVDVVTNGGNYGWDAREGSFTYISGGTVAFPNNPDSPAFTRPVAEYDHSEGAAISGGFVYRGSAIPALAGKYIFGDLNNGRIFYIDADATANPTVNQYQSSLRELFLTEDGTNVRTLLQLINETPGVSVTRADLRFGQDALGNLLLLNKRDGIARILLPAVVPEPSAVGIAAIALASLAMRRRRAW